MPNNVTPVDILETVRTSIRETDAAIADLKRVIQLQNELIETQRATITSLKTIISLRDAIGWSKQI